jgi:hypothetical protein
MSRARRVGRARNLALDISPVALALLRDEPITAEKGSDEDIEAFCLGADLSGEKELERTWFAHEAEILAEWIQDKAGSRPSYWWKWSAPKAPWEDHNRNGRQPRQRLGGTGTPAYEWNTENLWTGLPRTWIVDSLDPEDPPQFESQASYLKRHGLLLPGEERRADFSPVAVIVEDGTFGMGWHIEVLVDE